MIKFLLVNKNTSLDNGGMALVLGIYKALKSIFGNSTFYIFSFTPDVDRKRYKGFDIKVVGRSRLALPHALIWLFSNLLRCITAILLRKLSLNSDRILGNYLSHYSSADVIIDLQSAGFADAYGRNSMEVTVAHSYPLLLGKLLGKPVVMCALSIDPIKNPLVRFIVKFIIMQANLVTVREEQTLKYLRSIGVRRPIYLASDTGFLLEAKQPNTIGNILSATSIEGERNKTFIGVSPSQIIHRWSFFSRKKEGEEEYNSYTKFMAAMCDYLIEKFNSAVILIPHNYGLGELDERIVSRRIWKLACHKDRIKLISEEYDAMACKGIISQCSIFISCRLHPAISSTSSYIPTMVLAFNSNKFQLIRDIGLEEFIIDMGNYDPDELLSLVKDKINVLWASKREIRKKLSQRIPQIQRQALLNAELIVAMMRLGNIESPR